MNAELAALFRLGLIVVSANAQGRLTQEDILRGIQRHKAGDWGEMNEQDRQLNNRALTQGARLLSVYHSTQGVRFWLITEADRSVTTVLLPQDD